MRIWKRAVICLTIYFIIGTSVLSAEEINPENEIETVSNNQVNKPGAVNEKIEKAVVAGYKAVETGVVTGYKAVENSFVNGYKFIEKFFVDIFAPSGMRPSEKGDTVESD